ncbi:MAG: hypothetical protein J07HX5_00502 [halophilic archaeon J07HX5]|jgi:hypothetical protein|nr:MAG: hypothetical protein J07HX5_00502 [halophilic archaeon J07HX5]
MSIVVAPAMPQSPDDRYPDMATVIELCMSRRAAEAGFKQFLEPTVTAIREEFSVERMLRDTDLELGGRLLDLIRANADTIERQLVSAELKSYQQQSLDQFQVVLDYVESDAPVDAFASQLLAHDSYMPALDPTLDTAQQATVADAVLTRLERLGDGVAPVVRRPEAEFWPAVDAAFNRQEAVTLLAEVFPFTGPLRAHREWFAFTTEIDPGSVLGPLGSALPAVTVDYTDETVRSMVRAEEQVINELQTAARSRISAE